MVYVLNSVMDDYWEKISRKSLASLRIENNPRHPSVVAYLKKKSRVKKITPFKLTEGIPWMECDLGRYSDIMLKKDIKRLYNRLRLGTFKEPLIYIIEGRYGNLIEERVRRKGEKKRKWKNYRVSYPDVFYDSRLRAEVSKRHNNACLMIDDDCNGSMNFHHRDRNKQNNAVENLAYLCFEHHFGVHSKKYVLPNA